MTPAMNTTFQLDFPSTLLVRFAFFLTRTRARAKAGRIQHLEDISYRLLVKAMTLPADATAHAFRPLLELASAVPPVEWGFLANEESGGRKVLVYNTYLKVVLIRWAPGEACARHFHPNGGGMFTVLEGAIREDRFLNASVPLPYETRVHGAGAMSYIDDTLGAHIVSNTAEHAAVTLHAYLKYRV